MAAIAQEKITILLAVPYLYITGRKKLLIDTGGYKVNPFEIEAVLVGHPKVSEAIVAGVESPHAGQLVKAIIVPCRKCQERYILEYCQDCLAEFKISKIVEFRSEIPKSSVGKILRNKIM
ncbi:MAG: hypothetical protein AAGA60_03750 [Cyanobacteria bacterium P01_E01_bin.42]